MGDAQLSHRFSSPEAVYDIKVLYNLATLCHQCLGFRDLTMGEFYFKTKKILPQVLELSDNFSSFPGF